MFSRNLFENSRSGGIAVLEVRNGRKRGEPRRFVPGAASPVSRGSLIAGHVPLGCQASVLGQAGERVQEIRLEVGQPELVQLGRQEKDVPVVEGELQPPAAGVDGGLANVTALYLK